MRNVNAMMPSPIEIVRAETTERIPMNPGPPGRARPLSARGTPAVIVIVPP